VLISLLARRASGSLVIDCEPGQRTILVLVAGVPQKLSTTEPVGRLADLLVNLGCVDPQIAAETFAAAQAAQSLHGEVLVAREVITSEILKTALQAQIAAKLGWASALAPETTVDFYENVDFLESSPPCPPFNSPLEAVWAVARTHIDLKSVAAVLRQLVHRPLRLHQLSQPQWFGFDANEWSVIESLTAGTPDMQSLIQQSNVPVRTVQVMLYILTITRQLDLGQRKPPIGYWTDPLDAARIARTSRSGSMPAVAHTARPRQKSTRTVPPEPIEQQRAESMIRAVHALNRAEFLLERHRLDDAEHEAKVALECEPLLPECRALYAWIQVCKLGEAADLRKMLAILTDALEKNPVQEAIRFRRAQLLNRLGHTEEAQREYQLIVELNPSHVDAKREIRLWELRSRSRRSGSGLYPAIAGARVSERPQPPGLFGRLFKK
jgi:tetratricopeptide (TPR) repeat protein